ncbi:glycoside hydrolase family 2 protein, partial [Rhizobium brockwellii]|uniref:glycoside hydrolase family 2 protein n=2 Tax=Rhizobium/Agrobacterium group TaxID=227290 RepID=UPI00293DB9B8
ALDVELEVVCLRGGKQQVVSGSRAFKLAARDTERLACTALFGAFFDTTYAFRFGPPAHDASVARMRSLADGAILAESFHFPCGRGKALHDAGIEASFGRDNDGWFVDLRTDRLAQSVHIDVEGYRADDDWFHLAPGATRRVKLHALSGAEGDIPPAGEIRSLGSSHRVAIEG